MLIDFGTISADQFEELIYELLIAQGFKGERPPSQGQDRGIDSIVSWRDTNPVEKSEKKYVVQCKNYKDAVGTGNIKNILETITYAGANGYILAVASRITSGLQDLLQGIQNNYDKSILVFSGIEIRNLLVENKNVFLKYFPNEYRNYNELLGLANKQDISDLIEKLFGEKLDEMALNHLARKYIIFGFNNIGELENVLTNNKTKAAIVELYNKYVKRDPTNFELIFFIIDLPNVPNEELPSFFISKLLNNPDFNLKVRAIINYEKLPLASVQFDEQWQSAFGFTAFHFNENKGTLELMKPEDQTYERVAEIKSSGDLPLRLSFMEGINLRNKSVFSIDYNFDGLFHLLLAVKGEDGKYYFIQYIEGDGDNESVEFEGKVYAKIFNRGEPNGPYFLRKELHFPNDLHCIINVHAVELLAVNLIVQGTLSIYQIIVD